MVFVRNSTPSSGRNNPASVTLARSGLGENPYPSVTSTSPPPQESDVASLSHLYPSDPSGLSIPDNAGSHDAASSEHHDPIDGNDIVIAVMGLTGAGKSSFINTAAGRTEIMITNNLKSQTQTVKAVRCIHPDGRRNVVLVDTPGFDDTCLSDAQILRKIANWLKETYQNDIKLTGLLYLHRISDVRMAGTPLRNLSVFKDLCGNNNMKNIVLVTTMWDEVEDESVGVEREAELLADFWKDMIRHGSRTCRYQGTRDSAWEIISRLDLDGPRQKRAPLQIQREMVDRSLPLHETTAAKTLLGSLAQFAGECKKAWEKLRNKTRRKPKRATLGNLRLHRALSRTSTIGSTSSGASWSMVSDAGTSRCASPDSTAPTTPTGSAHSICSINGRQDMLSVAIQILGVAHQMADISGIPMLRGVIGTAMRIAQLIQEMGGIHHAIAQVIESAGWLLNEIAQYAAKSKLSKDMKRALSSFQRELTSLQTVVAKFPERNRIARFLLHDAEIQAISACTAAINAVYEKLEVKLAMDNHQAIVRLEDQLKALYNITASRRCECGISAVTHDESLEAGSSATNQSAL